MFLTASFLRICTYQHLTHRIVFNSFTNRIFFNSLATRSHQRFHKDRFPAIAQTHSNFKLGLRYTLPPPFSWQAYLGFFVLARIFYEHSWRANIGCRVNSTKKKKKKMSIIRERNCVHGTAKINGSLTLLSESSRLSRQTQKMEILLFVLWLLLSILFFVFHWNWFMSHYALFVVSEIECSLMEEW